MELDCVNAPMAAGEIIVEQIESDDSVANIALPLRHEDRTAGALLIRVSKEFDEDDRALLIGGRRPDGAQPATRRSSQGTGKRSLLAFFSARKAEQNFSRSMFLTELCWNRV